jgi:hypothetical protein
VKGKTADEKREYEKGEPNTRVDLDDDLNMDDDGEHSASHISGTSKTDDTLQKLDDIK